MADVCLKCGSDLRIAGTKADGSLLCRDRLLDRPGNEFAISASRDWVHPIATGGEYLLVLQDSLFKPLLRSQHPHDPNIASYYWAVGSANLVSGRLDDAAILLGKARAANARLFFTHFRLAASLALKRNLDEARSALADSIALKPEIHFARPACAGPVSQTTEHCWRIVGKHWPLVGCGKRLTALTHA